MAVVLRARGAGVRKPPREETAGGVERPRVRRDGDFGAGGVLARCIGRVFWKGPTGSIDRDGQNRRLAEEIEGRGGCPEWSDGERGHCWSRAGEAEVQHWNVAANLI
jgi:hypothetical protein